MAEMTKKERIRAVLAGGSVDRTPASLWGHNFQREWTPRDLFEHTVEDYRSGDWDFIKFNPRSTYFAEAWGNAYERPTANQQPALRSAIVKSSTDLEDIFPVSPHEGVLGDHLFALRMLVDEVGDEVDILHTVFSPLSVTAQLCGTGTEFRDLAEANSAAAHGAVQSVCETLTEYAAAAVEMGASGVFFAPLRWASHETCDEDFYREYGRPYDLQLLLAVNDAPFNAFHVCRTKNMIDLVLDYPVAAFNWADRSEGNPGLAEVRERTSAVVMGGIDHTRLHDMSEAEVEQQVAEAISAGPDRVIAAPGCAIRPETSQPVRAAIRRAAGA